MEKLKIAFLVTHFPRLSETFVLNQITGLIGAGHEVDIYAYEPSNEPKIHEDVLKYNLMARTFYYGELLKNMPSNKSKRILTGIILFANHLSGNLSILLNSLNVFKYKREAASLKILYTIVPFLGRKDYDIVHCHFGPNGNIGMLLKDIGIFTGKIITVFHGYDMSKYIQEKGKGVYRELFAKGDYFLPISKIWKNEMIALGCKPEKIMIHHMGIETKKYGKLKRSNEKKGKIKILTVGRLVEKKGIQYGIEAVGKISKEYPYIEYLIIGDGSLRDEMELFIKNMGLVEIIKLLGWRRQDEIIKYFQDSDILLAPSVTGVDGDQEGIPVVLMEAMAIGLPIVSTIHSGIPEIVEDGISGILVPERDANSLAASLIYLIEHPEIRFKMGVEGRRIIEKEFDVEKLNARLIKIYEIILGKK